MKETTKRYRLVISDDFIELVSPAIKDAWNGKEIIVGDEEDDLCKIKLLHSNEIDGTLLLVRKEWLQKIEKEEPKRISTLWREYEALNPENNNSRKECFMAGVVYGEQNNELRHS
ncbi:MAG: hypothetical protein KAV87_52985 [Desulfobacteraceae bacterium]|nr:hypothetical protein [Desulfobacteraceae bacterium]